MRNYLGDVLDSFRMSKGTLSIFTNNLIAYPYALKATFTQVNVALTGTCAPNVLSLDAPPLIWQACRISNCVKQVMSNDVRLNHMWTIRMVSGEVAVLATLLRRLSG